MKNEIILYRLNKLIREVVVANFETTTQHGTKTPKALNMNNPVQVRRKADAARGRENRRQNPPPSPRQRGIGNSVGVQPLPASCCAPTEHRVALRRSAALAHTSLPRAAPSACTGLFTLHTCGVSQI